MLIAYLYLILAKVFDRRGNGFITSNDLRSVLQCLGEQLTENESNKKETERIITKSRKWFKLFFQVDDMIEEVDINGDGRIDYDEFVASLKAEKNQQDNEKN